MPEKTLIEHCSPTLAGLKTANMFSVRMDKERDLHGDIRRLNGLFQPKGLRIRLLRETEKNALVYLYRPKRLAEDLEKLEARRILEEKGYPCGDAECCLLQLIRHLSEDKEFPHEIGLFLGYPPSDVRCFLRDSRDGVKCSGCWKSYGNEAEAQETFQKFDKCTRVYRRVHANGRSLTQLTVRKPES